ERGRVDCRRGRGLGRGRRRPLRRPAAKRVGRRADEARPGARRAGGGGAGGGRRRSGVTRAGVPRVVTFGELLLRLSPPDEERLLASPELLTFWGGAEANVAVGLGSLGVRCDEGQ